MPLANPPPSAGMKSIRYIQTANKMKSHLYLDFIIPQKELHKLFNNLTIFSNFLNHFRRHSTHNTIIFHIFHYDCICSDNHIVADMNITQYLRSSINCHIITKGWAIVIVGVSYCNTLIYPTVLANSSWSYNRTLSMLYYQSTTNLCR